MIKRIRPSFFSDVSGWDITTAYTILPSTRALSQRVKRTRSLISREICSVFFVPCPEAARIYTMASSIFIYNSSVASAVSVL